MSTLDEVTTRVFLDLADEAKKVFTTTQVQQFIRDGVVEVNRVAPNTGRVDVVFDKGVFEYAVSLVGVYAFQLWGTHPTTGEKVMRPYIPGEPNAYGEAAIDYRRQATGGLITVTPWFLNTLPWDTAGDSWVFLRCVGYAEYTRPSAGTSQLGMGWNEEEAVRIYAKWMGFDLMTHDRALFQQWQSQTNNTDVSPVMMMNMSSMAARDWDRVAGQLQVVRRTV